MGVKAKMTHRPIQYLIVSVMALFMAFCLAMGLVRCGPINQQLVKMDRSNYCLAEALDYYEVLPPQLWKRVLVGYFVENGQQLSHAITVFDPDADGYLWMYDKEHSAVRIKMPRDAEPGIMLWAFYNFVKRDVVVSYAYFMVLSKEMK